MVGAEAFDFEGRPDYCALVCTSIRVLVSRDKMMKGEIRCTYGQVFAFLCMLRPLWEFVCIDRGGFLMTWGSS